MNEFLNPKSMTASVILTHQSSGVPRLYPSSVADYWEDGQPGFMRRRVKFIW